MAGASAEVRAVAARAVAAVMRGQSLDQALPAAREAVAQEADRALLQALVFGVLRDYRLLAALTERMLKKPLKASEVDLHALLLVGLYQLRATRVPAHAAVAETVAATACLDRGWARGLVNALLRRFQRERVQLEAALGDDWGVLYSHPDWLVRRLCQDWDDDCEAVLAANNQAGPMTLRVNLRRTSREGYLRELRAAGIEAAPGRHADSAVVLSQPCPVRALPGFEAGRVSVQDSAAQLAAGLLAAPEDGRILDACAAPGGKTGHVLERYPDARVTALDLDGERLARVRANLDRLRVSAARLIAADASRPERWWDGQPFDSVLLDAPCSGTGVIRRHPDIKWLRRADDIGRLAVQQGRLLRALWPLLAPGGHLVYATCSTLCAENEAIVGDFLTSQDDAVEVAIATTWGESRRWGRRIRPGADDMDGFYYAILKKRADSR